VSTLAVTTSMHPDGPLVARAKAAARRLGVPYLPRRGTRPSELLERAGALLVIHRDGEVSLQDAEGQARWSPGMALLRLKRLEAGEEDTLVRVAALRPGEAVLDCTLGLGQDALVAARAVGSTGRVVGVERSLPLLGLVSEGLAGFDPGPESARIETVHADAASFLREQPDRAFDCVIFDPMFGRPTKAQPAFELLRRQAVHEPLTREVLDEARRVARRAVVVKAARYADDLSRLGLQPLPGSRYTQVVWSRVDV